MVKQYPGDYEYEEAAIVIQTGKIPPLADSAYSPVVEAFYDNMGRIQAFHLFPLNLMLHMQVLAAANASAIARGGNDPTNLDYQMTAADKAAAMEAFNSMPKQIYDGPGWSRYMFSFGQLSLKDILRLRPTPDAITGAIAGVEAILAAMITAAYGALETLAEDLWRAAADKYPILVRNWAQRNKGKMLSVEETIGRDMRTGSGSLLLQKKRVEFVCFHDIRNAYRDSFGDVITEVFENYKEILHAEKVRHLIAHRAGVIDEKFKREMAELGFHDYDQLCVGDRLNYSGIMVRGHINACVTMALNLIAAVDSWSATAPRE